MNTIRYYVALILVIILPTGFLFWLLIHPFVRFWRRLGPGWTYGIVCSFLALGMVSLFRIRQSLLAVEFGTNYLLPGPGSFAPRRLDLAGLSDSAAPEHPDHTGPAGTGAG